MKKEPFQIRYYQEEAVLAIYNYFMEKEGNPIVALPTGTGKSVVIAELLRSIFAYFKGQRILMLTHVKELIAQNYAELIELWPLAPAGIYSAGLKRREVRAITFAGIASVVNKAEMFGHIDMVIIDECHLIGPDEDSNYKAFLRDLKKINPLLKSVGLTATHYRMGQGLLTDITFKKKKKGKDGGEEIQPLFTDICYDITGFKEFNRLIGEGFICPLVPRKTAKELDVSGVHLTGGEFNQGELQAAVDRNEITALCIDEMIEAAFNGPVQRNHWLIFATGVEHAEHIADALRQRGISAQAVHSKLKGFVPGPNGKPEHLRDNYIRRFKEGEITCLVNNNVLTTGFNSPWIDLIGVMRPTNSTVLWVQMLGRGTRPYPGKLNCLVMDFAKNTARLGPINDPVLPRKVKGSGNGHAPVKICEKCGTYNHASVRFCIHCNAEFPKLVKIEGQASEMELIRGEEPQVEIFAVRRVDYDKHFSKHESKPDTLKAVYLYGLYQSFTEWICLAHPLGSFPSVKARKWWRQRAETEPPESIDEAITRLEELQAPTHLRVLVNSKHPEILAYDFSGTAFGTQDKTSGLPELPGLDSEDVPF